MILDLDEAFAKFANPRMSAGLIILHSLLNDLKGEPVEPREVRETVDELLEKRSVSKQSITNAAQRLEKAKVIDRKENKYVVNYGYLVSLLLNTMLEMNNRILDLEEDVLSLKTSR
jgi:DNA-binding MarR family transcriptional regulator